MCRIIHALLVQQPNVMSLHDPYQLGCETYRSCVPRELRRPVRRAGSCFGKGGELRTTDLVKWALSKIDFTSTFAEAPRMQKGLTMSTSGNGTKPTKTAEEVTIDLRHTLEDKLGAEKADAILDDPTSVKTVVGGEGEAADVAEIMLKAWHDLSTGAEHEEAELEETPKPKRRSRLGRLLRFLTFAGIIAAVVSFIKGRRGSQEEEF